MLLEKYKKIQENITRIALAVVCLLFIGFIGFTCINLETVYINLVIALICIAIICIMRAIICKKIETLNKEALENYENLIPKGKEIKMLINFEEMNKNFNQLSNAEREILSLEVKEIKEISLERDDFTAKSTKLTITVNETEYCVYIGYQNGWIDYIQKGYFIIENNKI